MINNQHFFCPAGIETRFGLAFPKYKTPTSNEPSSANPPLTKLLGGTPQTNT